MSDPKDTYVTLSFRPGEDPPFLLQSNDLPTGRDGELIFKNDGHPGFWVNYKLDESFGDYVFPNDKDQALCSAVIADGQNSCPDEGVWSEFYPHKVKDGNRTLVVRNINGKLPKGKDEVRFGYTLYVTENRNGDGDFLGLDPIGSNQNGNFARF